MRPVPSYWETGVWERGAQGLESRGIGHEDSTLQPGLKGDGNCEAKRRS